MSWLIRLRVRGIARNDFLLSGRMFIQRCTFDGLAIVGRDGLTTPNLYMMWMRVMSQSVNTIK